ncbi:MAG: V-type ATPase subunit [Candidatus Hydrogenedentes bacterium]|nr:V-type ATPase subunit [Candidatus Hydrogenedentota bacterium]
MISLGRYAESNALLRITLPRLLSREEMLEMARAPTLQESWAAFRRTAYGEWLREETVPDQLRIERRTREITAAWFYPAARRLGGPAAAVGAALLSRWELDHLIFCLRLWQGRDPRVEEFLHFPLFEHDIPAQEVAAAKTLEELADVLASTPYASALRSGAAGYRETGSIVQVELALERAYYRRLREATGRLGGLDGGNGARIVSDEIDAVNLTWLSRLMEIQGLPIEQARGLLIPGPSQLSRELATPGETAEAMNATSLRLLGKQWEGGDGRGPAAERLSLIERAVDELSLARARAHLAAYPFSITGIFALQRLLLTDLRNVCTLFAGKRLGVNELDCVSRLRGVV